MELLDACDNKEKDNPSLTKYEIASNIDEINNHIFELSESKEQVKENGTIYETDPDSRMMKTNKRGADICHNVQITVDDKTI